MVSDPAFVNISSVTIPPNGPAFPPPQPRIAGIPVVPITVFPAIAPYDNVPVINALPTPPNAQEISTSGPGSSNQLVGAIAGECGVLYNVPLAGGLSPFRVPS